MQSERFYVDTNVPCDVSYGYITSEINGSVTVTGHRPYIWNEFPLEQKFAYFFVIHILLFSCPSLSTHPLALVSG
jgi:hypothetical protein